MIFEVNVVGFFCIRDWFTAATIFREMVVTLTLANVEQSEKLYLCVTRIKKLHYLVQVN